MRHQLGREAQPSAAIIDSQSVKTSEKGPRGYDQGKNIKGRKQQILVDTQGLLLKVFVHPANLSDSDGGQQLLSTVKADFPRMAHPWVDQGYKANFVRWVEQYLGWTVVVVQLPRPPSGDTGQAMRDLFGNQECAQRWRKGFHVLPRRWEVERTLAWLSKQRRLSKDYELLPKTTQAWIYISMFRLMLRRLATAIC